MNGALKIEWFRFEMKRQPAGSAANTSTSTTATGAS